MSPSILICEDFACTNICFKLDPGLRDKPKLESVKLSIFKRIINTNIQNKTSLYSISY